MKFILSVILLLLTRSSLSSQSIEKCYVEFNAKKYPLIYVRNANKFSGTIYLMFSKDSAAENRVISKLFYRMKRNKFGRLNYINPYFFTIPSNIDSTKDKEELFNEVLKTILSKCCCKQMDNFVYVFASNEFTARHNTNRLKNRPVLNKVEKTIDTITEFNYFDIISKIDSLNRRGIKY